MEEDTEREIDKQACVWPGTPWWMLRLTPSQAHLRHGCPWGRRQLPCYIRAPVTCPLGWQTDLITGSCRRCSAPRTSHSYTVQSPAAGFCSRASDKTTCWNVTRGLCAKPEALLSPSPHPSVPWCSWQLRSLLPWPRFGPGSSPAFDASSSVSITGSFSFTIFFKHHPRFHPWLSHPALNPTHKWLPSSHIQTKPSPKFQTWFSLETENSAFFFFTINCKAFFIFSNGFFLLKMYPILISWLQYLLSFFKLKYGWFTIQHSF